MSLFGPPGLRSAVVPKLPGLPGLDDQRRLVTRARREARQWLIRGVLLLVVSALAMRRGWILFGVVFLLLALLSAQLARSTRRRAAALAAKLELQEHL